MIAIRSRGLRAASSSLAGSTFIYAVITGVRSGVSFLMLPIYARAVTPAAYGQLAIAWVIASLLTTLLSFGLEGAITRWYFRMTAEPESRNTFVASAWKLLLVVPNLVVVVGWLVIASLFPSSVPIPLSFLLLGALQASLWVGATIVPFALLRAQGRIGLYAVLVLASMLIFVAFAVLGGSLGFWIGNAEATAFQAQQATINFSLYPGSVFNGWIRVLIFTVVPAGFISHLPVELLRTFDPWRMAAVLGFTLLSLALALVVFRLGLRRYESGNLVGLRG